MERLTGPPNVEPCPLQQLGGAGVDVELGDRWHPGPPGVGVDAEGAGDPVRSAFEQTVRREHAPGGLPLPEDHPGGGFVDGGPERDEGMSDRDGLDQVGLVALLERRRT